ncbi:MAG: hypothetical protein AMXMBFR53_37580 [Gemmatimonadota bacterium]
MSKSVTSVLLARLVDAGTVALHDRIGDFVADVPASDATMAQLASHMGGVRHYTYSNGVALFREQFSRRHYETAEASLGIFVDDPLEFEPGTAFGYSTHGYTLLAAVLERATGSDYLSLLSQSVTGPLDLMSTGPDNVTDSQANRAEPYREMAGRFFSPLDADPSYKWAGGGLLSTPSDLVMIAASLMGGTFVSTETRDELWNVRALPNGDPNPQRYGLGWRIDDVPGGDSGTTVRVVHHGGTSPGGSAFLVLVPSSQVAVAFLTNRSVSNTSYLRDGARSLALRFASAEREGDAAPGRQ